MSPWACTDCGIGTENFTVLRTEIMGTNRGSWCQSKCVIKDSWVHGTNLEPVASNLAHASGVRVEQYTTLVTTRLRATSTGRIRTANWAARPTSPATPTSCRSTTTRSRTTCLLENPGNGFCAYGGGTHGKPYSNDPANATHIVFRNNVFQRGATGKCGAFGPITDFEASRSGNQWIDNTWDDGRLVKADGSTGGVAPPRDTDGDGLTDDAELRRYLTDPRKRDTDRDGLERQGRGPPPPHRSAASGTPTATACSDGAEVRRYKTSPRKEDTDGDGLSRPRRGPPLSHRPPQTGHRRRRSARWRRSPPLPHESAQAGLRRRRVRRPSRTSRPHEPSGPPQSSGMTSGGDRFDDHY